MRWAAVLGVLLGAGALAVAGLALFSASIARRVERALPPGGDFIDVDGARLHYVERGSGPAIVTIHGLAGQGGHFTHSVIDLLADEFRVIVVDRPGAGYSTRRRGAPAGVRAQARVIADFIAALDLDHPFVVGHSLGGAIALALALDHPHAVRGLALVAPFTRTSDSVPEPFKGHVIRSPLLRELVARTIAVPLSIRRGRRAVAAAFAPDVPPKDFAIGALGLLSLRPSAFRTASEDLMASNRDMRDVVARYSSLTIPVGVLFGTGDAVLDHHRHGVRLREEIPHADVTLIEGAGHMLPVSAAQETADWIRSRARLSQEG
jgi:pimeloyl-ACP methyl ester carboxylesterase